MNIQRLGDHVSFLSGFAFKSSHFNDSGDGMPVIRIRDVTRGYSQTYYSGEYDDRYVVDDGDYLIGMDGEFSLARWRSGRALLNQRVCKIDDVSEDVDKAYLARFLPLALKQIEDSTPFVTVKHLSVKKLNEIQVPLPSLNEQKHIAKILDAADALRAKRRESIAQLDALLQSAFLDLFGDPILNEKNWETEELAGVVKKNTIVTYGIVQAGEDFPGGIPYIRTGDIVHGEIDPRSLRRTDPKIAEKFSRSRVDAGDLVMSIRATVGTVAMVPSVLEGANLTQGTARISPGENLSKEYLLYYIMSDGCQSWIERQVKGATFREITLGRLRTMPVLVPPMDLQLKFSRIVRRVDEQRYKSLSQLTELDELFLSLQQKAFRGWR